MDRRLTTRLDRVEQHGVVRLRVRPGHEASLLDISRDGAAIDTACRLLPGAPVELQIDTALARTCARGRVLRCMVVNVQPHRLTYRAVVRFEDPQTWVPG